MWKPIEIELFRAGSPAARGITADKLAEVATYDCAASPIPICFGHPKDDTPAAGLIEGFRAEGNSLFGTISSFTNKAIDGIKAKEWINRSMAFFDPTHEANPRPGKWSPRHVGLLGGAAPGIPGMAPLSKALAFSADDELLVDGDPAPAVIFSGAPTPVETVFSSKENATMTEAEIAAEKAQIAADRAQFEKDRNAFAASQATAISAGNATIVDGLVTSGKVLPAEAADLKLVFDALGHDELTFSADAKGTAASKLGTFLFAAIGKRAPVDEQRRAPSKHFDPAFSADATTDDMEVAEEMAGNIEARARDLMAKSPGLSFAAAVGKLQG